MTEFNHIYIYIYIYDFNSSSIHSRFVDLFVCGSIFIYCELILSIERKVFIFMYVLSGPRTIEKHICGKNVIKTDLNLVRICIFEKNIYLNI